MSRGNPVAAAATRAARAGGNSATSAVSSRRKSSGVSEETDSPSCTGASTSSTNSPRSRFGSAANQSGASRERHLRDGLEFLRDLARDHQRPLATERRAELRRGGANAMRGLVDHERARLARDRGQQLAPRLRRRRQKAQKQQAIGIEPGRGHGGDRGAGAGNRHHRKPCRAHRSHERALRDR